MHDAKFESSPRTGGSSKRTTPSSSKSPAPAAEKRGARAPMHITLDHARALDALVSAGTYAKAAVKLGKAHTAVVYAIQSLEAQTGLRLVDRRHYRSGLTEAGTRVLAHCRMLLAAEHDLLMTCEELRDGWEPALRIVLDGVFPLEPVLAIVGELAKNPTPTKIEVFTDSLSGVEETFLRREADLMITVLPAEQGASAVSTLRPIAASLVAHRSHVLVRDDHERSMEELSAETLLMVRSADPRLALSTAVLHPRSLVHLADFGAEKTAIMRGLGFGWMPNHLVAEELARGEVRLVRWPFDNTYAFEPRLYQRTGKTPGRAAKLFIARLRAVG